MGHQLREFPLNEAEGGCPEVSSYDIGMSKIRTFPNNQILPFETSGATKGSVTVFPGVFGPAAEGLGNTQPTPIPDYFYYGSYPLSKQPLINKPQPWE